GPATFKELEIMTNKSKKPVYLARALLNGYYTATINSLTFASGTATVGLTGVNATTGASPAVKRTAVYKLGTDNKLTLQ
ncbi:MAG: hypothetical protein NTW50_03930, partial [Candidatus Berkelbacteria bacterium]|nr:hypothetical protein [Candidatus Berkelbacteria bacterium]